MYKITPENNVRLSDIDYVRGYNGDQVVTDENYKSIIPFDRTTIDTLPSSQKLTYFSELVGCYSEKFVDKYIYVAETNKVYLIYKLRNISFINVSRNRVIDYEDFLNTMDDLLYGNTIKNKTYFIIEKDGCYYWTHQIDFTDIVVPKSKVIDENLTDREILSSFPEDIILLREYDEAGIAKPYYDLISTTTTSKLVKHAIEVPIHIWSGSYADELLNTADLIKSGNDYYRINKRYLINPGSDGNIYLNYKIPWHETYENGHKVIHYMKYDKTTNKTIFTEKGSSSTYPLYKNGPTIEDKNSTNILYFIYKPSEYDLDKIEFYDKSGKLITDSLANNFINYDDAYPHDIIGVAGNYYKTIIFNENDPCSILIKCKESGKFSTNNSTKFDIFYCFRVNSTDEISSRADLHTFIIFDGRYGFVNYLGSTEAAILVDEVGKNFTRHIRYLGSESGRYGQLLTYNLANNRYQSDDGKTAKFKYENGQFVVETNYNSTIDGNIFKWSSVEMSVVVTRSRLGYINTTKDTAFTIDTSLIEYMPSLAAHLGKTARIYSLMIDTSKVTLVTPASGALQETANLKLYNLFDKDFIGEYITMTESGYETYSNSEAGVTLKKVGDDYLFISEDLTASTDIQYELNYTNGIFHNPTGNDTPHYELDFEELTSPNYIVTDVSRHYEDAVTLYKGEYFGKSDDPNGRLISGSQEYMLELGIDGTQTPALPYYELLRKKPTSDEIYVVGYELQSASTTPIITVGSKLTNDGTCYKSGNLKILADKSVKLSDSNIGALIPIDYGRYYIEYQGSYYYFVYGTGTNVDTNITFYTSSPQSTEKYYIEGFFSEDFPGSESYSYSVEYNNKGKLIYTYDIDITKYYIYNNKIYYYDYETETVEKLVLGTGVKLINEAVDLSELTDHNRYYALLNNNSYDIYYSQRITHLNDEVYYQILPDVFDNLNQLKSFIENSENPDKFNNKVVKVRNGISIIFYKISISYIYKSKESFVNATVKTYSSNTTDNSLAFYFDYDKDNIFNNYKTFLIYGKDSNNIPVAYLNLTDVITLKDFSYNLYRTSYIDSIVYSVDENGKTTEYSGLILPSSIDPVDRDPKNILFAVPKDQEDITKYYVKDKESTLIPLHIVFNKNYDHGYYEVDLNDGEESDGSDSHKLILTENVGYWTLSLFLGSSSSELASCSSDNFEFSFEYNNEDHYVKLEKFDNYRFWIYGSEDFMPVESVNNYIGNLIEDPNYQFYDHTYYAFMDFWDNKNCNLLLYYEDSGEDEVKITDFKLVYVLYIDLEEDIPDSPTELTFYTGSEETNRYIEAKIDNGEPELIFTLFEEFNSLTSKVEHAKMNESFYDHSIDEEVNSLILGSSVPTQYRINRDYHDIKPRITSSELSKHIINIANSNYTVDPDLGLSYDRSVLFDHTYLGYNAADNAPVIYTIIPLIIDEEGLVTSWILTTSNISENNSIHNKISYSISNLPFKVSELDKPMRPVLYFTNEFIYINLNNTIYKIEKSNSLELNTVEALPALDDTYVSNFGEISDIDGYYFKFDGSKSYLCKIGSIETNYKELLKDISNGSYKYNLYSTYKMFERLVARNNYGYMNIYLFDLFALSDSETVSTIYSYSMMNQLTKYSFSRVKYFMCSGDTIYYTNQRTSQLTSTIQSESWKCFDLKSDIPQISSVSGAKRRYRGIEIQLM